MYSEKRDNAWEIKTNISQVQFRHAVHHVEYQYDISVAVAGTGCFFVLTAHNLSVYVRENISFSVLISDV